MTNFTAALTLVSQSPVLAIVKATMAMNGGSRGKSAIV